MEYLLFLQNLRESFLSFLTPFFVVISEGVLNIAPLVAAIIFLCVDKKWGRRTLFALCFGNLVTNVIKITACINRPWIRDSRLHVAKEAAESATGYSFPSGHTTIGTTVFGSIAFWQRAKKLLACLMALLILLTMLSRNWLGAHTLEDVSVALVVSVLSIMLVCFVLNIVEEDEKKDIWVLLGVVILCIAVILFSRFKSFPLEYLEDGSLLVDPSKMIKDVWGAIGMLLAWTISWFVEKRYINMELGTKKERIIRGIVSVIVFILSYKIIFKKLGALLSLNAGAFVRNFCSIIIMCLLIPWIVSIMQKRKAKD